MLSALREAVAGNEGSRLELGDPLANIAGIVAAPAKAFASTQPTFGKVEWQAPPSYRTWLESVGRFSLIWNSPLGEMEYEVGLLGAGRPALALCRRVYAGHGAVSDVKLSLDHLVPFATGGNNESAFCFDTAAGGPEYPVRLHHEDEGRYRIAATGAWHPASPEAPEFPNFLAWLEWLVESLGHGPDPCEQGLGSPNFIPGGSP